MVAIALGKAALDIFREDLVCLRAAQRSIAQPQALLQLQRHQEQRRS
jgi:hypothetical protein